MHTSSIKNLFLSNLLVVQFSFCYYVNMEFTAEGMYFLIETHRRCNTKCTEIHRILSTAWPDDCPSVRRIQQIVKEFEDGTRNTYSQARGQGRPTSELRNNSIERVEAAIQNDNALSLRELAEMLDLSESMIHRILSEDLEQIWMITKWVPHVLTEANKQMRITCCRDLLAALQLRLTKHNLVTIDEKWFYCRAKQPRNTVGSWMGPGGDRRQTAIRTTMENKFLVIVAVTNRGVHYFNVLEHGKTVNSDVYVEFLEAMFTFFARLQEPLLRQNIRLIHDNARPHVSQATRAFLEENNVRLLKQPPYSPDCNLCDRYVFPRLEALRCKQSFETREEIQEFLDQHMPNFSVQRTGKAIAAMMQHFEEIIRNNGNYVV